MLQGPSSNPQRRSRRSPFGHKLLAYLLPPRILERTITFPEQTMLARQYLTAFFSVALVFGASRDLRTQKAPQGADVALRPATTASATTTAALNKYCVTCHNEKVRAGGLALNALNPDDPGTDARTWEKVVRKLRSGAMPPAGRPRPDAATYDAVASHLEAQAGCCRVNPARARQAAAVPSPEPHRIQEFDSRPAEPRRPFKRCRSRSVAAGRQFQQRIRQHRRSAFRIVDTARAVFVGRSEAEQCCRR